MRMYYEFDEPVNQSGWISHAGTEPWRERKISDREN